MELNTGLSSLLLYRIPFFQHRLLDRAVLLAYRAELDETYNMLHKPAINANDVEYVSAGQHTHLASFGKRLQANCADVSRAEVRLGREECVYDERI